MAGLPAERDVDQPDVVVVVGLDQVVIRVGRDPDL